MHIFDYLFVHVFNCFYIFLCVYLYKYIRPTYVFLHPCIFLCIYLCVYLCTYAPLYATLCVNTWHVDLCTCTCISICICIWLCNCGKAVAWQQLINSARMNGKRSLQNLFVSLPRHIPCAFPVLHSPHRLLPRQLFCQIKWLSTAEMNGKVRRQRRLRLRLRLGLRYRVTDAAAVAGHLRKRQTTKGANGAKGGKQGKQANANAFSINSVI